MASICGRSRRNMFFFFISKLYRIKHYYKTKKKKKKKSIQNSFSVCVVVAVVEKYPFFPFIVLCQMCVIDCLELSCMSNAINR